MFVFEWICNLFWSESFWLVPGNKWQNVTNGPDKKVLYPDIEDFWYQIPLVFAILSIRFVFERKVFVSLGKRLGAEDRKQKKLQYIPLLELAYQKCPKTKDVTALAKQLDMSERQVQRWWRIRKDVDRPSNLDKFCENAWKATINGSSYLFGLYILWDKDYFWDFNKLFVGIPHQGFTNGIWWYYMISTSNIWVALIMVFYEIRRKDYVAIVVHHLITLMLLLISWMSGFHRLGVIMLNLHDSCDVFLDLSKVLKAIKYELLVEILFAVFTVTWFYKRIYHYPIILFSQYTREGIRISYAGLVLYFLLICLLFLHVLWSVLILKAHYNYLRRGVIEDVRSSSSENADNEQCEGAIKKVKN